MKLFEKLLLELEQGSVVLVLPSHSVNNLFSYKIDQRQVSSSYFESNMSGIKERVGKFNSTLCKIQVSVCRDYRISRLKP